MWTRAHQSVCWASTMSLGQTSKLNVLVLIRKPEAEKGEESQRTLTLKGWIWENMVKVFEILAQETKMDIEIELTSKGEVHHGVYI